MSFLKSQNLLQLPTYLQKNLIAIQLKKHLDSLNSKSGFSPCILYGRQNKYYFLQKDAAFPYISFDMTMFTLMRNKAQTIITSGASLRKQPHIYGQSQGDYGKEQLRKIYAANSREPINLLVYTSSMKDEEIRSHVCSKYFNFVSIKQLGATSGTFKQIAKRLNELGVGPTIYENGWATLGRAMNEVQQNEENFVEMIILSLLEGMMPEKYIGDEYTMTILDRDFNKVWESDVISSTAKHDTGQEKPITLKFVVYTRKQKLFDKNKIK